MKLSFSTNAFTKFDLFQSMNAIHGIGYQGVEIMADEPHLWPMESHASRYEEIRRYAGELGLEICNLNGFMMKAVGDIHHPSWIEEDPKKRALRRRHTEACLHAAHALGVPFVSTEPGGPVEGGDPRRAMELFANELEGPAALALSLGVRLLIEPEPGLLLPTLETTLEFLRTFAPWEGVGINFDLGHFYCEGDDPAELIRNGSEYLSHVHLEDIAADRVHRHLIPGRGAMDFKSIFNALRDVGYEGFVTVELYPYEEEPVRAAEEALRFLKHHVRTGRGDTFP